MSAIANQLVRDVSTAAEISFAGVIWAVEAAVLFGVFYYISH